MKPETVARLFTMESDGVYIYFRLKWWARPLGWLARLFR
jgi:hypothetical protein